jgi:hypothetical protein
MKTTTLTTTLGIAALFLAGAFSNGCSSAATGGAGGSGGSATGQGGSTGNGGTTGNGGSSGNPDAGPLPACASTLKDKDPCTFGTDVDCSKTCGISLSGAVKPCTCVQATGLWSCSVGTCVYPSSFDHTCYVRPATVPACPNLTQSNTTTCTPTTTCTDTICANYVDSGGTPKTGWCACTGTKTVDGGAPMNVYLCASTNEWPPQQ